MKRFFVVFLLTFAISVALSFVSKGLATSFDLIAGFIVLFVIILIGIIFDIVGVAATASEESPFHAMAVDKVRGASQGIWLVRNADRVASFCNDMVGDIAGTLSGAIGAGLVFRLIVDHPGLSETLLSTFVVSAAAALTVGGKAFGKSMAIKRANDVIFLVARLIRFLEDTLRLKLLPVGNAKQGRNRKPTRR